MRNQLAVIALLLATAPAQSVSAAIAKAEHLGAKTGIVVLDPGGRVLFERRGTVAVAPASNQKVLTAAALLHGLGRDHRFVTRFELREGALVVQASGDPNWIHDTVNAPTVEFGEVAARLQQLGVQAVRGIQLEAGPFTGPTRPASWPQNQLDTYYCAPTGPFVLDQGVFWVRVEAKGDAAEVTVTDPPFGPPVENRIRLVTKKAAAVFGAIDRGRNVLVRGEIWRHSRPFEFRTAVADPQRWYRAALRGELAQAGIGVDAAAKPAHQGVVAEISTALGPALLRLLEDSSNFDAEQLTRVLGAKLLGDGSLAGGMKALQARLIDLVGPLPEGTVLLDGSGLSAGNRVSPALIAATLHAARHRPFGETLNEALPVAGETGSLEDRFLRSPLRGKVRAKTGWIRGASSLSGYVPGKDGERLVFSILMDYPRNRNGLNKELKQIQEEMVEAIAAGRLQ